MYLMFNKLCPLYGLLSFSILYVRVCMEFCVKMKIKHVIILSWNPSKTKKIFKWKRLTRISIVEGD